MSRLHVLAATAIAGVAYAGEVDAAVFTVNSANDVDDGLCDGTHCSLREAIKAANAGAFVDTILFAVGSGAVTVAPTSPLPAITGSVTIDGTSQPGYAGTPIVELDGSGAGAFANGLSLTAGSSTSRDPRRCRFRNYQHECLSPRLTPEVLSGSLGWKSTMR